VKEKGWQYIYPAYLDSSRSRSTGRRVPRSLAVEKPRLEEIVEAARKLGLEVKAKENAKYPRAWWSGEGCALVKKRWPKEELLRKIAYKIREERSKTR